jgi:hypothetical protein
MCGVLENELCQIGAILSRQHLTTETKLLTAIEKCAFYDKMQNDIWDGIYIYIYMLLLILDKQKQ